MATSVMAGMNDREDSDMEESAIKGVTVYRSIESPADRMTAMSINTAPNTTNTTTPTVPTSTTTPSFSIRIRDCGSRLYECCSCLWTRISDFLAMIWNKYNKINMTIYFLIGLGVTLGLLIFSSGTYDDRLSNPSSFHYTTCIITKISQHKEDDDWWNTITFIYGREGNSDWSQQGRYKIKREYWDKNNNEGSIGTCIYSEEGNNWSESFTLQNYLVHSSTSAMWLILDNKFGLISWIIFFAFSSLFCIIACVGWLINKCDFVRFGVACVGGQVSFIVGCMMVGWPVMIMSSVIMTGLKGPLGDGIAVTDVYDDMGDCIITGYELNVTYIPEREDAVPFTLVEYNVFSTDGDLIAIHTDKNTTQPIYFGIDDVENCYKNRYSQQMIINEYPDVEWLQLPMEKGTVIVFIILGVLLICTPCTIGCFYNST